MIITDLVGRLERLHLSPRNSLYALFEAVSNSIDAIASMGRRDGSITVELEREQLQERLPLATENTERIVSIRVTDNGVGFTDENFIAFQELDTRIKAQLGGKGVGRLLWLKVFRSAAVESVYQTASEYRRRTFDFVAPGGVESPEDRPLAPNEPAELRTCVSMSTPCEDYREALHQRATTVAGAIQRHFLSVLLSADPPQIVVVDGDQRVPVALEGVTDRHLTRFAGGCPGSC